jgi:hypothetical protein
MPTLSIERREITAQPILFVRLRPGRHELSPAIGEVTIDRSYRPRSGPLTRSNTRSGGGNPLAAASAAAFS